jgi:hypothetical protein
MDFLEIKEQFENKLKSDFELLELHFAPYSFGSGMTAYRIKGQIIKVIYDGKDNQVELLLSAKHDKYSNASWTTIYTGVPIDFIENGLQKLSTFDGQNA